MVISSILQLSSSLRERLKRCGRYHASPKSTSSSPGMTSTPSKDCIKENFISPLSRKRYSTTPLKIENPKRVQCDGSLSEQEGYDGIQTKLGTETSVKNEFKTEATSLSHQMGGDRQKTPLTSKSRFKHAKMRSSRLDFQNKHDSANSQSSNSSSVESHGQQGQDMLVLGSCDAGENKTTELLKVKDNQNLAGKCDLTIKDSDQTVETKTKHDLLKEVAIKEETLRKLRMVKTYRTKVTWRLILHCRG